MQSSTVHTEVGNYCTCRSEWMLAKDQTCTKDKLLSSRCWFIFIYLRIFCIFNYL